MRIATWNLWCPKKSKRDRAAVLQRRIRQVQADLWILTETNDIVSPGSDFHGYASTPISGRHSTGESRTTVWSRYRVLQQIETHDPNSAVCVQVESPLGNCIVYGTVFPHKSAGTNDPYFFCGQSVSGKRSGELHRESISMHEADWLNIRSRFPSHYMCVAGDLNQSRDGRRWGVNKSPWAGTNKDRELLSDSLELTKLECLTAEDFVESGKLTTRSTVEHICLDQALAKRVTSVDAWEAGEFEGKKLSDHNGLHVDIE